MVTLPCLPERIRIPNMDPSVSSYQESGDQTCDLTAWSHISQYRKFSSQRLHPSPQTLVNPLSISFSAITRSLLRVLWPSVSHHMVIPTTLHLIWCLIRPCKMRLPAGAHACTWECGACTHHANGWWISLSAFNDSRLSAQLDGAITHWHHVIVAAQTNTHQDLIQ